MVGETLEVRESAEGRRVCGIAAPFNKRFDTGDYVEEFARGAFANGKFPSSKVFINERTKPLIREAYAADFARYGAHYGH